MDDRAYPSARTLLVRYGSSAKKSWGQNFLVDPRVLGRIAGALGGGPDDVVVEIGAGLGHLTHALSVRGSRVLAVERDRDMARVLRGELGDRPNVEIVEANALDLDWRAIALRFGRPVLVAGNLPYNISSQIIVRLLDARRDLRACVLMLQRELGDRLVAPPGSRTYGALSVLVQARTVARSLLRVAPAAFLPRPKVHSVVVRFDPREVEGAGADERAFRWTVNAAFGQRRKTLRNALSHALVHGARGELAEASMDSMAPRAIDKADVAAIVDDALRGAAIDGTARAETLDVGAYDRLARGLFAAVSAAAERT